jgi:hypothetical protein
MNYKGLGGTHRKPVKSCQQDLLDLAATLNRQDSFGVFCKIEPVIENDEIIAIKYPYERLHPIPKRLLRYDRYRLVLCAAYFHSMAFLLEHLGLCLADPGHDFMATRRCVVRYVDYGRSIIRADDYRCQVEHHEMRVVTDYLCTLWRIGISNYPSQDALNNFLLDKHSGLAQYAADYPFIDALLSEISAENYDAFLDPKFYKSLAKGLPETLPYFWCYLPQRPSWIHSRGDFPGKSHLSNIRPLSVK